MFFWCILRDPWICVSVSINYKRLVCRDRDCFLKFNYSYHTCTPILTTLDCYFKELFKSVHYLRTNRITYLYKIKKYRRIKKHLLFWSPSKSINSNVKSKPRCSDSNYLVIKNKKIQVIHAPDNIILHKDCNRWCVTFRGRRQTKKLISIAPTASYTF